MSFAAHGVWGREKLFFSAELRREFWVLEGRMNDAWMENDGDMVYEEMEGMLSWYGMGLRQGLEDCIALHCERVLVVSCSCFVLNLSFVFSHPPVQAY